MATMREMRLDLPDCEAFNILMDFDRPEDEPLVSAQERLRFRKKSIEQDGKIYLGEVLELEGQPVGMISMHNIGVFPSGGQPIGAWLMVHPDHRRQGCGRDLYAAGLEKAREHGFDRVYTNIRGTQEPGLSFAGRCGFQEVDRAYKLSIDLSTLTADHVDAALDEGVQLVSIGELQETDPDWSQRLLELSQAFWPDLPSRVGIGGFLPETPEAFEKLVLGEFEVNPDSSFVAMVDGTWAATTWISTTEEGADWCNHCMTGVHPGFRRRGLVKAMKRAGFAWGQKAGIRYIHTNQHDTNKPMLKLNMDLGFNIDSTYILMVHHLESQDGT